MAQDRLLVESTSEPRLNKKGRRVEVERRADGSEHSLWSKRDHQSLPLNLGFLLWKVDFGEGLGKILHVKHLTW